MQRVFSSEGCADAMVAAGHAAEQESPTARTIRMVMEEAAARERERCAKIAQDEADEYERQRLEFVAPGGKHWSGIDQELGWSIHAKRSVAANIAALIRKG